MISIINKKEIKVSLTEQEIEFIINELENSQHNIYEFCNYGLIIKKLKGRCKNGKSNLKDKYYSTKK